MKKTKRKVPRLSRNATDEEIVRWTKSHDVFDRLEAGVSEIIEDHSDLDQVLRDAIFQANTPQLNMRLSPAMKAVLANLPANARQTSSTLARISLANGWNETNSSLTGAVSSARCSLTNSTAACRRS